MVHAGSVRVGENDEEEAVRLVQHHLPQPFPELLWLQLLDKDALAKALFLVDEDAERVSFVFELALSAESDVYVRVG